MEKVSVIVPVYNSEKYLAECISSVIEQTYKNWELLLIDDCSTDKLKLLPPSLLFELEQLRAEILRLKDKIFSILGG